MNQKKTKRFREEASVIFSGQRERRCRIGVYIFIGVSLFLGCRASNTDKEIVARVGDAIITREDLKQKMAWEGIRPDQESEFVDRWVNRELLYQEAKRLGLRKSEDLRLELELVEKEYLIQKLLERTFSDKIQILEEEITAYYEKNKDLFQVDDDEVRVFHILTKTKEESDLAYKEIMAGKAFDKVARERSIGMFREKGGDMGFIKKDDVIPEVARYAFRLTEGSVSPVFSSKYGYHILKVVKKRAKDSVKDLMDVRDEVIQRLRVSKERSVYFDLLFQLQNKTKVYVSVPHSSREGSDSLDVPAVRESTEEAGKR